MTEEPTNDESEVLHLHLYLVFQFIHNTVLKLHTNQALLPRQDQIQALASQVKDLVPVRCSEVISFIVLFFGLGWFALGLASYYP